MIQIVQKIDQPAPCGQSLRSFLASLVVHALLALLLWNLAYNAVKSRSILLTASAAAGGGDVSLEWVSARKATSTVSLPEPAATIDAGAAIESLLSEVVDQNHAWAESNRSGLEPPSIEFFGTRAYGNRFVFVLDISYSMKARRGERFRRARDELIRSVSALRPGQSYYVFLFCWSTERMFYDPLVQYVAAGPRHVEKLEQWIDNVSLGAGTDPRRALALAHQMNPDAVFLLSDGHFNRPGTAKQESGWIDQAGQRLEADVQQGVEAVFQNTPIHTVAFENPFTASAMQQIAESTGGTCRYIPTRSHKPIDTQRFLTALRHVDQKHRHDHSRRGEYMTRLSYAREFIRDGELAYAEYLVRPLRQARPAMIDNPILLAQVLEILDSELAGKRLEDFESPPELSQILRQDS